MVRTVVPNNRMIDVSAYGVGEHVVTMSEAELERKLENERFLEMLDERHREAEEGRLVHISLDELRKMSKALTDKAVKNAEAIREAQKAFEGKARYFGVENEDDVQNLINEMRYGSDGI